MSVPTWRSLLFVPANAERFVAKAHTRGADVIQLDVEDSVPPAEKDKARTLVEKAAAKVRRGGADVVVRINRPLALAAPGFDPTLDLVVRNTFAAIELRQALFDFREEDEPFNGVVNRGVRRKVFESLCEAGTEA